MIDMLEINEETVPKIYQSFPEADNLQLTYTLLQYSKFEASEKDITIVHMDARLIKDDIQSKDALKRIGWLIPVLSLISTEHNYAVNKHFIRYAYELFKLIKDKKFPETAYFLVLSDTNFKFFSSKYHLDNLRVSFTEYGVYPKFECDAIFHNKQARQFGGTTVISPSFAFNKAKGFIKSLMHTIIQTEINHYARFMYFYQVIELLMELVFYDKILSYKRNKLRLGLIRDKISELSSEKKLITLLYEKVNILKVDSELLMQARNIFGTSKDETYYEGALNAEVLYDLRNTIVHNYYRYDFKDELEYMCNHIEIVTNKIFELVFLDEYLRGEIIDGYFET
ncbi:hypothetical protein ACK35E_18135 [Aeromonas veronii]